jgi:copper chaperone CopZ
METNMRMLLAIVVTLGLCGLGASAQSTDRDTADNQVCLLKVSGMSCGACAATVQKAAMKIDGVIAATVSQPKGTAEITFDPARTTPDAIARTITEKTGFTAEVQTTEQDQR